jgi:hypothetical protein
LQPLKNVVRRVYRPRKTNLPARVLEEAAAVFGPGNRRLASDWGLGVTAYGYDGLSSAAANEAGDRAGTG